MGAITLERWGAVEEDAAADLAERSKFDLPVRLMFYVFAHSNRIGHTPLAPCELRRTILKVTRDGELVEFSPASISKAIRTGVAEGVLGEGSTARCLRAPAWFEKAATHEAFCKPCGIKPANAKYRTSRRTSS